MHALSILKNETFLDGERYIVTMSRVITGLVCRITIFPP